MTEPWPFGDIAPRSAGVILADPPWRFDVWGSQENSKTYVERHYKTMAPQELTALPVGALAEPNCVLFLWSTWPVLPQAMALIQAWGFTYKTCGFDWMKADVRQADLFREDADVQIGAGYWTRSNSEPCLLATRGKPRRINADVRMGIIERRRQHSRKPDCIYQRIERLVAGPYVELFSRSSRAGWSSWGDDAGRWAA